ncbi:MAG: hypothetical protein KDE47_31935, partial [Caldilineaceae bacterium]|nr:hypothetical protein [Caldilineaceae bacterium]
EPPFQTASYAKQGGAREPICHCGLLMIIFIFIKYTRKRLAQKLVFPQLVLQITQVDKISDFILQCAELLLFPVVFSLLVIYCTDIQQWYWRFRHRPELRFVNAHRLSVTEHEPLAFSNSAALCSVHPIPLNAVAIF